ncbi:MAG: hypothetical protein IJU87_04655 [Lachnospiraceae bacterium]|nr:hypothetical protein [Lachnospiraceae bacterium]
MAKDISKVNYDDAPEDIKGKGKMTEAIGTCKFCGQAKAVRIFPGEDADQVATNECGCYEARKEHDISVSVSAVSKAIDKKFDILSDVPEALAAIKAALEPVAREQIDNATFKISGFTFIVTTKDGKLKCIKKYTEIDEANENGAPE